MSTIFPAKNFIKNSGVSSPKNPSEAKINPKEKLLDSKDKILSFKEAEKKARKEFFASSKKLLEDKKDRIRKRYDKRIEKLKKTFGSKSEEVKALLKLRDKDLKEEDNKAKLKTQNSFNTTSTINDNAKTKLTAFYKVNANGYPVFYAEATKSGETFTSQETPTFKEKTNEEIKSIVTGNFFNLAQQIYKSDQNTGVLTPANETEAQYNVTPFELIPPKNVPWQQPKEGPEDKEKKRADRKAKRKQAILDAKNKAIDTNPILQSTPKELLAKGKEALPPILYNLAYTTLYTQIIPSLEQLVLEYISDEIEDEIQSCPPGIQRLIELRNRIVGQLNNIAKKIDQIGTAVTGISRFLNTVVLAISSVDTAQIILSAVSKAIPAGLPGAIPAALNDAQSFIRKSTFDKLGNSKLAKTTITLSSAALVLSLAGRWVTQALGILARLDVLIARCDTESSTLTSISDNVKSIAALDIEAQNTQNNTTYQGFILDTQIVPFTPTVNRTQAIGKNAQGIILIKGEPSFTDNNQTLINELKLIIDRDNLQAY